MNDLWLAALPRWLDASLWRAVCRALDAGTTARDWPDLLPHVNLLSAGRWQLAQRPAYLSAARAADPAACQQWHLIFFQALLERQEVSEAAYHFEQAGNLCLARLAYDELGHLIATADAQPVPLPRFAHLVTYYQAVLAVERHDWAAAAELLTDLRSLPNLDADLYARCTNTLGVQAYHQAQYDTSFHYYQQAYQAFQQLGDGLGQLRALINMAIVHNLLGQFDDAITCLQDARSWSHSLHEAVWESWVLNELGINYKDLGQWDNAQAHLEQALAMSRTLNRQRGIATALANLGELFLLLGQTAAAERHYQEARQLAGSPFMTIEVLGNLGLLRQLQGQYAAAADLFDQALAHAAEIHSASYQALIHYRLGTLAWQQGDLTAARVSFEQSIHLIEGLRSQIQTEDVRIHLFGGWQQVYSALFLLTLAQGDAAAALTYAERARARAFLDLLSGRGPNPALLGEPLSANAIQAQLPADMLLLVYFNTNPPTRFQPVADWLLHHHATLRELLFPPDRTVMLAVTSQTIEAFPLVLDAATALRRAFAADGRALAGLTPGADGRLTQPWVLRSLGTLLLGPVLPRLADTQRIAIVPHGPLHYVPFTALQTATGAACFAPTATILFAPSATVLLTHGRQPLPDLGSLIPPPTPLVVGFAPDLRHAEAEAQSVAALLGGRLLLGNQATQDAFLLAAPNASLIHLSCHGTFNGQAPLQSGLFLADGVLTATALLNRPAFLQASLVTLSACESGRSGVLSGDELLGLVRAFLAAGAPVALVSLWAVDELSTRLLMRFFYTALAQGISAAAALRQAQQALTRLSAPALSEILAAGGLSPAQIAHELARLDDTCEALPDHHHLLSHPYYWAGFALIGGVPLAASTARTDLDVGQAAPRDPTKADAAIAVGHRSP